MSAHVVRRTLMATLVVVVASCRPIEPRESCIEDRTSGEIAGRTVEPAHGVAAGRFGRMRIALIRRVEPQGDDDLHDVAAVCRRRRDRDLERAHVSVRRRRLVAALARLIEAFGRRRVVVDEARPLEICARVGHLDGNDELARPDADHGRRRRHDRVTLDRGAALGFARKLRRRIRDDAIDEAAGSGKRERDTESTEYAPARHSPTLLEPPRFPPHPSRHSHTGGSLPIARRCEAGVGRCQRASAYSGRTASRRRSASAG